VPKQVQIKPNIRHLSKPLSPWVFILRNPSKSLPMMLSITLAVMLIAGITAIMSSIPLSIKKVYGYSRFLTGATTRGDMSLFPELLKRFENAPIPIEKKIACRTMAFNVKSLVGNWPFFLHGFHEEDMKYIIQKMGFTNYEGKLPKIGEPEAFVTEPVARNLDLSLGGILLSPNDEQNYSPKIVRVVGIAKSEEWFALTSYDYLKQNHFPPVDVLMVFATTQNDQRKLDQWTENELQDIRARAYTYPQLEKETTENFKTLFRILNLVIAMLVIVVTLMMGMFVNIYLSQRTTEFGLLQALGYTRKSLISRALSEASLMVITGWILGVTATFTVLSMIKTYLMQPRGYYIDPLDLTSYGYTLPVPIAILFVAVITVWFHFKDFDPINVVERRIV
jgi:hypothetical protein